MAKKATDEQLLNSYRSTGSIWKTAKEFGMCGQSVHERLTKIVDFPSESITADEERIIREAYARPFLKGEDVLAGICLATGRGKTTICRAARRMGLTNASRGLTADAAAKQGSIVSESFRVNGHPRGMLGKKHSQATKDLISTKTTGRVIPSSQIMQMLKTRVLVHGTAAPHNAGRGSWKAGWREIGGQRIYARSRWEANYARYLQFLLQNGQITKWEHEPETFWFENIKRGVRSYLPDFRVTLIGGKIEFHEVKGWMDPKSLTKLKRMKKYHPSVAISLVQKDRMKTLGKQLGRIIKDWER